MKTIIILSTLMLASLFLGGSFLIGVLIGCFFHLIVQRLLWGFVSQKLGAKYLRIFLKKLIIGEFAKFFLFAVFFMWVSFFNQPWLLMGALLGVFLATFINYCILGNIQLARNSNAL